MSLVVDNGRLERPGLPAIAGPHRAEDADYHFLVGRYVDAATLARAKALAAQWGVHLHDVLISNGWIDEADYYRALAEACGTPFAAQLAPGVAALPRDTSPRQCLTNFILKERAQDGRYLLAPAKLRPTALRVMLARLAPYEFVLATPRAVREAVYHHFSPALAQGAVEILAARRPEQSARGGMARWQRLAVAAGIAGLAGALLLAPAETVRVLTLLLGVLFVPIIGLRLVAAFGLLRAGDGTAKLEAPRVPDAALPVYTILVPLYREAHMLAPLIRALTHLDWPAAKLDIKLILEAKDRETVGAARALALPGNVEIVVVPDFGPRTKPKALNYALPLARGEYVVVYDAEDRPEPGQLRRAYAAFQAGPPNLATVQARLNIYNVDDGWLTRQFTLEYSALFDGLLPALDRLELPIPLGGTSNHFRAEALKWLLAWDPFNVTEDADLGTRLARSGYCTKIIASTTYEEAPRRFGNWARQRTRWLKGFMQTWLVHMRDPRELWRVLGARGFLGFQVMVGGTLLSALVHPWFYALAVYALLGGTLIARPASLLGLPFWGIAWFVLITGYAAAMALTWLAARRRGLRRLSWQVALMPAYWLLISSTAYRAIWQFAAAPFNWEKTEHGNGLSRPSGSSRG